MSHTPPAPPYAVIGLGLVGGSLAKALKHRDPAATIFGVDPSPDARRQALADGAVTSASAGIGPELAACTLVVVCTPFAALPAVLKAVAEHVGETALVTDVTGVKVAVAALAAEYLPATPFVGGHPMAGGSRGAYNASRADLFAGKPVAVCPPPDAPEQAEPIAALWRELGAEPVVMTADEHDHEVAATSHLPYLTAVAQMLQLADAPAPPSLVGRGLLDTVRHADFAPEVMAAVAAHNPHLPAAARALAHQLQELADLAEHDTAGLEARTHRARQLYEELLASRG